MNLLNNKQKYAVDQTINGENILITGPAGTGKSFTIKYIIDLLKEKKMFLIIFYKKQKLQ